MHSDLIVAPKSGRLDKVLSELIDSSRNQVEKLIREGLVSVDGKLVTKPSHKVAISQSITYKFLEAQPRVVADIDFDVEILFEDNDILVVNKPSGLVVHPAPSVQEPTLVDWLIHQGISLSTISGEERYGIVHRIDKETTGALVVAKNNESHAALSAQLQSKSMGRYYIAITDIPLKEHVSIDAPIARNPHNRLKMAVVEGGREARSDFLALASGRDGSGIVAVKLHSGRTHQIRVHLESMGRHIVGDETYGYKGKKSRVLLHAYMLYLVHPITNKKIEIEAPLFADMQEYIEKQYDKGEVYEKIKSDNLEHKFNTEFSAA